MPNYSGTCPLAQNYPEMNPGNFAYYSESTTPEGPCGQHQLCYSLRLFITTGRLSDVEEDARHCNINCNFFFTLLPYSPCNYKRGVRDSN